jgi:hypothetical protein
VKKLAHVLVGALFAGSGVVGLVSSAHAVDCPYSGCLHTSTVAKAPHDVRVGSRPTVKVKVTSGNVKVKGDVRIACTRRATTRSVSVSYAGNTFHSITGPRLTKRGTWSCTARFSARRLFRASSDLFSVRATR